MVSHWYIDTNRPALNSVYSNCLQKLQLIFPISYSCGVFTFEYTEQIESKLIPDLRNTNIQSVNFKMFSDHKASETAFMTL